MVAANQLADNGASTGVATYKWTNRPGAMVAPGPVTHAEGLRFYFSTLDGGLDGDSSRHVWRIVEREMHQRAQSTPAQGLASRALQFCRRSSNLLGSRGTLRSVARHLGPAYTRSLYKNREFRRLSAEHSTEMRATKCLPPDAILTADYVAGKAPSEILKQCPFCLDTNPVETPAPSGTFDHLYMY